MIRRALSTGPAGPSAADAIATWARVTSKRAPRRALDGLGVPPLDEGLRARGVAPPTRAAAPETLQVNIGLTCNLACSHCHVESSPSRSESMAPATVDRLLDLLANTPSIRTVDITGGAPEMHAAWPTLVRGARALGLRVIDRCNLTILQRPGYEWVAPFLADHAVDVIASLPCYSSANVEAQRGAGVFSESIAALQRLNALGYAGGPAAVVPGATPIDSPLAPAPAAAAPPVAPPVAARRARLDLVYNPSGAFLPPEQAGLEAVYRAKLAADFGISFDSLFCIANMPIKRFADELRESGQLGKYLELLVQSFNARNVDAVMCRGMVHVAYDGSIHDCDFNYSLQLTPTNPAKRNVFDLRGSLAELSAEPIRFSHHCWGCVAGAGSS